jgi:small-conductance mechanosensitive channel
MRAIVLLRVFIEDKYDIENENNLKARKVYTQLRIIQRIMIILVVIIALGSILISFDKIRQLGISIFASAGIAGIVIGFAAQKMIASFIAGLQIALTQPIRIDDAVFVEGQWGWIEEITITYVVVRIWDKRRLIVPSTYFIENSFQNWTRNSSDIMGTVFIYADYGFPVDALRKKLTGLLRKNPKWDKKVNVIQVTDATEKTKEMRILVSAKNSPTLWDLRVELREKLIDFIRDEYPQHLPHSRVLLKNNIADYSTGESA